MSRQRLIGSVVAGVLVVFALAGCSLIPAALGFSSSARSSSGLPRVGDCWNATNAQAAAWSDWKGAAPVDCSKSHVLYTYAIGTVTGVTAKSWGTSGDPSTLSTTVEIKAADACTLSTIVPKLKWNQQLVNSFFFVPSEAAWKSGARWVRCDIGVLAYGTTLDDESFAKLPPRISTLVAAISADPKQFDFCINTQDPGAGTSPLDDPTGIIADCTQNPQWALTARGNMPEPPGAAYPSNATANAESGAICSKYVQGANEVWIAYLPSKSDWTASNDREVQCWIGQTDTAGDSGGVA